MERPHLSTHRLITIGLFPLFGCYEQCYSEIHVQVYVSTYVFNSFEYIARSGVAGSSGKPTVNLWRKYQTVFQSSCFSLCSHQQCMCGFQFFHILANTCYHLVF